MEPFFKDVSYNPNIIAPDKNNQSDITKTVDVFVSSTDRNMLTQSSNKYTVNFDEPYNNVVSVEIMHVHIPFDVSNTSNGYVVMKIDEVDIIRSNNKTMNKASMVIYEQPHANDYYSGIQYLKKFSFPKAVFNFRVTFYNDDGSLYDMGTMEHTIHLRIKFLKQGRRV